MTTLGTKSINFRKRTASDEIQSKTEPSLVIRRPLLRRFTTNPTDTISNSHDNDQPGRNSIRELSSWKARNIWGIIMVLVFVAIILGGPIPNILLIVFVQSMMFKEVISVSSIKYRERDLGWSRTLNWLFLLSSYFYLYGQTLLDIFKEVVLSNPYFGFIFKHHTFVSASLYIAATVFFVLNLKNGHYRFQFSQFGLTHVILLVVIFQSHFVVYNIMYGLFYFIFPVSLVIVNDSVAYLGGKAIGRTPLIQLSPKKTLEGFVCAFIVTILFGFFFSGFLAQFPYLTCPVEDPYYTAFSGHNCPANSLFEAKLYPAPSPIRALLGFDTIQIAPIQFHSIPLGIFASLIAPFGGFMASGFKRALKIKDFSSSIPGHGGVTDRMDCEIIMAFFMYIYYATFLKSYQMTVSDVLKIALTRLSTEDQRLLYIKLQETLIGQNILSEPLKLRV